MRQLRGLLVVVPALALIPHLTGCTSSDQPTTAEKRTSSGQPTSTVQAVAVAGSLLFADAGDVYVYRGTEATRLTVTEDTEARPTWSPDGSRIMFTRSDGFGGSDIFTIAPDGTAEERLTTTDISEEGAAWSPDGQMIAFSTFSEADGGAVWLMDADGTNPREIYAEQSAFVGFADWSPDNRRLLMDIDRGGGGELDLYAIGVNGKDLTQLTSAGGDDSGGRWAPDGKRILFWSENPQGAGIYLMNADGSQQRKVLEDTLNANTVAPAWSPDGDQIAWTAKYEGGAGAPIFVMKADGTGLQQLREALSEGSTLDWTG